MVKTLKPRLVIEGSVAIIGLVYFNRLTSVKEWKLSGS